MIKVKHYSSKELDGVACTILSKIAFADNVDIEYCDYSDINEKITDFIKNEEYSKKYDYIFITDIYVNQEVAELIDNFLKRKLRNIKLFDHKPTALWLNKYRWAKVLIEDTFEKVSGASIYYMYLISKDIIPVNESLTNFIRKVKRYDTWLWKTKYNDIEAKKLNDLLDIYGIDDFVLKVVNAVKKGEPIITEMDNFLLDIHQKQIDRYIQSKEKDMIIKSIEDYTIGVMFAEQFISELGNTLCERHPELDFVIIVDINKKSLHFRGVKDNIDLSIIAKAYGGGGCTKASGSPILNNIKEKIIELLLVK